MENEIMFIKLDDIIPNRFQPREIFDEEALNKLADSIRQHGVIEPILVRPVSNKYEIIAGERRYKASVLAGLTKIPAIVRQLDDKESSIVAFIENEHRSGVSAIEEAKTMERILKNNNMTQEELAKELGVNQSTIANKIRLLNLPFEVQDSLMHNEISERHARSLLSVKDENKQIELLNKIKEKKMTVRELDSEIKNMNNSGNDFMNSFSNNYINQNNSDFGSTSMNFDNYLNSNNNTPLMTKESNLFNSNVNEANNHSINPLPPMENSSSLSMPNNQQDVDFNNWLNDLNNMMPNSTPSVTSEPIEPKNDDFTNYLNNSDNSTPNESIESNDNGFMSYLNNYDNNNPVQESENVNSSETTETNDDGFMSYLNNYDNNNPIPDSEIIDSSETIEPNDMEFTNYLNNYDNSNPLPHDGLISDDGTNSNTVNASRTPENLTINNVVPPITSNFGNYVEDNDNYVDVSKQTKITSVDEIISKLSSVINEIKEKSVFKVNTDEINYDDKYQITIEIDKRDF